MKIGSLATVALLVISLLVSARVDAVNIKALSSPELKQAWLLFEMGNYKRADEALKSCYLKTTEDGATCSFLHARILDGQKNSLGAIDAYRKAYTFSSNPDIKQESLFRKSELFAEKNYAFETQKGFSEYVKLYPNAKNSKKAYLHLAQSLDASNKPAEALAAYEKAGEGSLALYGKANVLQKTGKTKEAQQAYDKAVGLDSDYLGKSDETRYLYAENLVQTGNIPKAKEMLKLITNEKLKEKADLTLGTLEAGDKKNAEAAKYLAKAATAKNRDVKVKALMRLAHVQAESAKPADAQQTLDTLKKLFISGKDRQDMDLLAIDLRLKEKNYAEAAKILKAMIAKNPNVKELVQKLQSTLTETANSDKELFTSLWKSYGKTFMKPYYEKLVLAAAQVLKENGGGKPYIDCLEWILRNASSEKDKQNALYSLSQYYSDMGDKGKAVKYLGQLQQYNVPLDDVLRLEAKVLYDDNDLKGVYEKMMGIKHLTKEDLPMLRESISAATDKDNALSYYEQALKTMGGDSGDAMAMAENLYKRGKKDEAVFYYKRVLAKDPSNEWALYRTASILNDAEALKKLSSGNSTLSKYARSIIEAQDVNKRLEDMP